MVRIKKVRLFCSEDGPKCIVSHKEQEFIHCGNVQMSHPYHELMKVFFEVKMKSSVLDETNFYIGNLVSINCMLSFENITSLYM